MIKPLKSPDVHHLNAALGWLGLGNHLEANEELERIAPKLRTHPDVLDVQWQIYAKESKWDDCQKIAAALTKLAPERRSGWMQLARATRRATDGGLEQAQLVLLAAIERFPKEPLIPYKLACYACLLGHIKEAEQWLGRAFEVGDGKQLKLMALDDPDLEKLWENIGKI